MSIVWLIGAFLLVSLSESTFAQDRSVDAPAGGLALEETYADSTGELSDEAANLMIADVYGLLRRAIEADVRGQDEYTASLLYRAADAVTELGGHASVQANPRYREVYRSVVSEIENYYGSADTLTLAFGDVFMIRDDMFATLNEVDEPLLENVTLPEIPPMVTTIPMTMNRLVESSIEFLLKEPDKHLNHWLSRAETYFPMIEKVFDEEGVPEELKYLAMVESGLNPRARSWARAVGMWQFIGATGKAYGLNVNGWVDERMDPEAATRAAARHLKDLHAMFGDWQLALAGYNYNPAKVRRALRAAESRLGRKATFWDIYTDIPRETRNYVPMFIATALIVSHPEAFNLKPVEPGPPYAYHVVPVYGMHPLSTIARLAGTSETTIKALNPALTRNSLPPSTSAYLVRIPTGTYDRFVREYEKLPEDLRKPATEHVIRSGETLSGIAQRYGTSVSKLMSQNGLSSTRIRVGQRLAVPMVNYSGASDESLIAQADGALVHYGPRNLRPIEPAPHTPLPAPVKTVSSRSSSRSSAPSNSTKITYRVKSGDTLSEIAESNGVSIRQLRSWNGIRGSTIRVGQRLTIYTKSSSKLVTHTVRRGETLSLIANKYSVSVSDLREWNSIKGSKIYVGQKIVVRQG